MESLNLVEVASVLRSKTLSEVQKRRYAKRFTRTHAAALRAVERKIWGVERRPVLLSPTNHEEGLALWWLYAYSQPTWLRRQLMKIYTRVMEHHCS